MRRIVQIASANANRASAKSASLTRAQKKFILGEIDMPLNQDPHQGQPVLRAGVPLEHADAVMVMLHGRGASAHDILSLAHEFGETKDWAFLAPQATDSTWYPYRFLEPLERNEPWLSSALHVVARVMQHLEDARIPRERIVLLGFSQGACLALEYAARHVAKYGGLVGLSGGLIGPEGTPRDYAGSFDQTPVFLGSSDVDFHVPKARVMETAQVLSAMGADVTMRLYPNMEHTVNADEIEFVRGMMERIVAGNRRVR
jgi:predicted esterase